MNKAVSHWIQVMQSMLGKQTV